MPVTWKSGRMLSVDLTPSGVEAGPLHCPRRWAAALGGVLAPAGGLALSCHFGLSAGLATSMRSLMLESNMASSRRAGPAVASAAARFGHWPRWLRERMPARASQRAGRRLCLAGRG